MQSPLITDEFMQRYLLGELLPEDRSRFEELYFNSDELFEKLRLVEEELIESYVRDELETQQRARFEQRYLVTRERRERVAFARSFAAMIAAEQTQASRRRSMIAWLRGQWTALTTSRATWRWAIAAGALVLIAAGALLRKNTLRPEFTAPNNLLIADSPELGRATFTLTPRMLLAVLPQPTLLLPAAARTAQFQLVLEASEAFQSYRAELRSREGEEIWQGDRLHATPLATGKALVFSVPALDLLESEYTITLSGMRATEVVLVLDQARRALIQIDPATGARTTLSQRGKLITPMRFAIEASGAIFVVNAEGANEGCRLGCGNVIKIDPLSGAQIVVSSGGLFGMLHGLALELSGDLLVTSTYVDRAAAIIRVDPRTGAQSIVSSAGLLFNPIDLALDENGDILVTEDRNQEGASALLRINARTGEQSIIAKAGYLVAPFGIALAPRGEIWIADQHEQRVVFAGPLEDSGGPGKILRLNPLTGKQSVLFSGQHFRDPSAIAFGSDGAIYVADPNAVRLQRGAIIRIAPNTGKQELLATGEDIIGPVDIAVAPATAHSAFVVTEQLRQYSFAVKIE